MTHALELKFLLAERPSPANHTYIYCRWSGHEHRLYVTHQLLESHESESVCVCLTVTQGVTTVLEHKTLVFTSSGISGGSVFGALTVGPEMGLCSTACFHVTTVQNFTVNFDRLPDMWSRPPVK